MGGSLTTEDVQCEQVAPAMQACESTRQRAGDPWVSPAFFASWFPFPDNSHLDWETLGRADYLYISHLHRDHFDAEHLRRFVSKQTTVLLPDYPTSELEGELRELGFTSFVRTRSNEPVALGDGLTIMIQALTSPTDGPIGDS